ncbi:MAG: hypothetical protein WA421_14660, partial [Nitrososphaeraceae archaeon]
MKRYEEREEKYKDVPEIWSVMNNARESKYDGSANMLHFNLNPYYDIDKGFEDCIKITFTNGFINIIEIEYNHNTKEELELRRCSIN